MAVGDLILVDRSLIQSGDEQLPDAGRTHRPHGVGAPVPLIEIADDRYPLGARGPEREGNARNPVDGSMVGSELAINVAIGSFVEEIQIFLAQSGKKGIGVVELSVFSVGLLSPQSVGEDVIPVCKEAFKKPCRIQWFERMAAFFILTQIDHPAGQRAVEHRPNKHPRLSFRLTRVHSQPLVGVMMFGVKDANGFLTEGVHERGRQALRPPAAAWESVAQRRESQWKSPRPSPQTGCSFE